MYFVDLFNSDLCDRNTDMTVCLNCTSFEDALAKAAKLKDQLKAHSGQVFTYNEPKEYTGVEVVVLGKDEVKRHRASSPNPLVIQIIRDHVRNGDHVLPVKYLLATV